MRVLHLLEMKINDIIPLIPEIAKCKFTHIQIGNVAKLKSSLYPNELNRINGYKCGRNIYSDWFKLYQQLAFEIGNDEIGSREDLIKLCKVATEYNIKIVADVVLRHLANGEKRDQDNMEPNSKCDKEILSNRENFLYKIPMQYKNRFSEIWHCNNLPSLNYTSDFIIAKYEKYLSDLIICGVKGLRVDMAKHFALPSEGGQKFWNVLKHFKESYNIDIYGETIQCGDEFLDQFIKETGIMTLSDYIGYQDKDMMVKFIYSHDMALTDNIDIDNERVIKGYHKICENNPNTLFYTVDYKGWNDPKVIEANMM